MDRRIFISATVGAMAGVAGCLGSGDGNGNGNETQTNQNNNTTGSETDNGTGAAPSAAFTVRPEMPDIGEEVTLDASESTGDIESYEWDLPDGTAEGETTTVTFGEVGEYEVGLTVTGGESASTTQRLTVTAPLTASFTITPPRPATGDTITLDGTASTGGVKSYEWELPDGTASGETATTSISEPGEYEIGLTVSGAGGESASTTQTVRAVRSATAEITVSSESVSTADQVDFIVSSVPQDAVEYRWDFQSDGTVDTTSSIRRASHTYAEAGTKTVTLDIETGGGTIRRATRQLTVQSVPLEGVAQPLVENAEQLEGLSGVVEEETIQTLRSRIETAQTRLENAEADPETIETTQALVDFQEQLVNNYEHSSEYSAAIDSALRVIEPPFTDPDEGQISDAMAALGRVPEILDRVEPELSQLRNAYQQVDGTLGREALDYSGELNQYAPLTETDGLDRIAEGFGQLVMALRELSEGRTAFMNQEWQRASERFTAAEQHRQNGLQTRAEIPDEVLERAPRSAGTYAQAFGLFRFLETAFAEHADAAEAAVEGNQDRAQMLFESATEELRSLR